MSTVVVPRVTVVPPDKIRVSSPVLPRISSAAVRVLPMKMTSSPSSGSMLSLPPAERS